MSWPAIDSTQYATYLSADSDEKLHKTLTLNGCTDYYQAEDIAEYMVRESRVSLTVSGKFGSRCFGLVPGDVVDLTYDSAAYDGKFFIVTGVGADLVNMDVTLQLKEYDSSVYTWNDARGNEPLGLNFDLDEPINLTPTSPTMGTITESLATQADGSTRVLVTVPFSGIPDDAEYVEVEMAVAGSNVWRSEIANDPETQSSVVFAVDADSTTYDIRLRFFIMNDVSNVLPSAYVSGSFAVGAVSGTKLDGIALGATANVVYQQNSEPTGGSYNVGDTWIDTDDNFHTYTRFGGAWVSRRDPNIAQALQDAADAAETADGKIVTFLQTGEPAAVESSLGDLWIDTDDGNKLYRYSGSAWVVAQDGGIATAIGAASDASTLAGTKIVTFYAASTVPPSGAESGDLWYQTDVSQLFRYSGTAWQEVASFNTGDLADLDTVGTGQIDDTAVTIDKIANSLQSTNYAAGSAGWKLEKSGNVEFGNATVRGAINATSLTIGGTVTGTVPAANIPALGTANLNTSVTNSLGNADSAIQPNDDISVLNNDSNFTTFDAADVEAAIVNDVTTIDGSKITTGTLEANRINAASRLQVGSGESSAICRESMLIIGSGRVQRFRWKHRSL